MGILNPFPSNLPMSSLPGSSSSPEPIIDLEAIENLRSLNPEDESFLKEIVDIFLVDTPARIAELRQAHASGDLAGFSRAAHTIKGSSSNLGAARLRSAAERLEHNAKAEPLAQLGLGIPQIETEFAAAKTELQRLT